MTTGEKLTTAAVLVAGLILVSVLYFLFFADEQEQPVKVEERPQVEAPEPTGEEQTVVSEIEGGLDVSYEEEMPEKEDKDVGSLTGIVLDSDKNPLVEADIKLYRSKNQGVILHGIKTRPLLTLKTGEDGSFLLEPLFSGDGYHLVVDHDLYMKEILFNLSVKEQENTELPPIQLKKGKTIFGKVKTDKGKPISGAVVSLYDRMNSSLFKEGSTPDVMVKTDENGAYSITNQDNIHFLIQATAPGYECKTMGNDQVFSKEDSYEFNFFLTKGLSIKGVVMDENMEPIEGSTLNAIPLNASPVRFNIKAVTDKKGKFEIAGLSGGNYRLSAIHPLYSTVAERKVEVGADNLLFILPRRSGLSGQVVDMQNNPVRDFWIKCELKKKAPDPWATKEVRKHFKDRNGRFIIDGLDPGKYIIEISAGGFANFRSEYVKVEKDIPTTDLVFQLDKGGSVSGYVMSPEGKPLKRVVVSLQRNRYVPSALDNVFGSEPDSQLRSNRTDKDGYFKIDLIVPGTYQLEFDHGKYPPHRINDIKIESDRNTEVETQQMHVGGTLMGRVYTDAGKPLALASVTVSTNDDTFEGNTTTDKNGFYKISDLPPGIYTVTPMPKVDPTEGLNLLTVVMRSVVYDVEVLEGETKELPLIIYR